MVTYLNVVVGQLLTWLSFAVVALYMGMVLMKYSTDGPRYPLSLELRDPVRSLQHFAVWLGVKILEAGVRLARAVFNVLLEASAQVGEWFMRVSPGAQERFRSRFLV